jgi:hypothetical protein
LNLEFFKRYNIQKHYYYCISDTRRTNPPYETFLLLGCTTDVTSYLGGYTKLIRNIYTAIEAPNVQLVHVASTGHEGHSIARYVRFQ